jgi:hypothetical protein
VHYRLLQCTLFTLCTMHYAHYAHSALCTLCTIHTMQGVACGVCRLAYTASPQSTLQSSMRCNVESTMLTPHTMQRRAVQCSAVQCSAVQCSVCNVSSKCHASCPQCMLYAAWAPYFCGAVCTEAYCSLHCVVHCVMQL